MWPFASCSVMWLDARPMQDGRTEGTRDEVQLSLQVPLGTTASVRLPVLLPLSDGARVAASRRVTFNGCIMHLAGLQLDADTGAEGCASAGEVVVLESGEVSKSQIITSLPFWCQNI